MAARPIPRPDSQFNTYQGTFTDALKQWWVDHGMDENDLKPLDNARSRWELAYPAHISARAAAESAVQEKDAARAELETQIRPLAAFVQSFPGTTDADRATIGLTIPPPTRTPTRAPTTRPMPRVTGGGRLMHTLRYVDESTPGRTAKPAGVMGAEVWVKVTEPGTGHQALGTGAGSGSSPSPVPSAQSPVPLPGFRFIGLSTDGGGRSDFTSADAGKTAHYALRWVSPRGEKGPWSEICSATVAA